MKLKLILLSFLLIAFLSTVASQLPAQTVTFKVRKVQIKKKHLPEELVTEQAFVVVEKNATFKGGDINDFRIWVQSNMVYPTASAEAGISGKVIVQFNVSEKGKVTDVKVLRGVNPELDKETTRCILSSPFWVPGRQGGKAVTQQFVIPVVFQLQ